MTAAVNLDGVRVTIGARRVLDGLTLRLERGEIRALVGLNGAGKTTALRVLLGMLRADEGRVRILGEDVQSRSRSAWERVGHLIETPFCYPELTARESIALSAALHGAEPAPAARRAEDLAERLGLVTWLGERVGRLSLGTRQKVGLVSALVHDPALVVFDEPTNGLDPLAVIAFREVLGELAARGSAALVTSHHFDELARVARAVDVLHRGRILCGFEPGERDLERAFFDRIVADEREAEAAIATPASTVEATR